VCTSCQSAVTFDDEAALVAGTLSVLPPSRTKLFCGAMGSISGRSFQALGRVRYGHERGFWDEWHLLWTDDGATGWLSEDEDRLVIERLDADAVTMVTADTAPGTAVSLSGETFNVVERGVATVEGGEGQLPFVVVQGEETPFVELRSRDGGRIATVEFGADGRRVFLGEAITDADLGMDWTRQDLGFSDELALANKADGSVPRLQSLSGGIRPLKCHACGGGLEVAADAHGNLPKAVKCAYCGSANDLSGKALQCPNCTNPVQTFAGDARLAKCPTCTHQIDLTNRSGPASLGRPGSASGAVLMPGDRWDFEELSYVVTGRLRYDGFSEGEAWHYWEYALFEPTVGYRWLVESDGKWSLAERVFDHEALGPDANPSTVQCLGRHYPVAEVNTVKVGFVDGELPWVARVGDQVKVLDSGKSHGHTVSIEWSPNEVEWYLCRSLQRSRVLAGSKSMKARAGAVSSSTSDYSGSGGTHGRWWKHFILMGLLMLIVGTGVAYYVLEEIRGTRIASASLGDAMFSKAGQTAELKLPGNRNIHLKLTTDSRGYGNAAKSLKGGWAHYLVTLTDASGAEVAKFTSTHADFYHGGTGPYEYRTNSTYGLRMPADGAYTVRVQATSGNVDGTRAAPPKAPLKLDVIDGGRVRNDALPTYLAGFFVFWLIMGFIALGRTTQRADGPKLPIASVVWTVLMWGGLVFAANQNIIYRSSFKPVVQDAPKLAPVAAYATNRAAMKSIRSSYSSSSSYGGYSSSSSSSSSRSYYGGGYSYGK